MKKFLNKNKVKKSFSRVAVKVLFFCFFVFLGFNLGTDEDLKLYLKNDILAQDYQIGTGDTCGTNFGSCSGRNRICVKKIDGNGYQCVDGEQGKGWLQEGFEAVIKELLIKVLQFMGILVRIAGFIFEAAINPDLFNKIFVKNGGTLYNLWSFIRDLLNLTFIFILLFSAFATVFQVSKYHLKNTVLWVVLMALLVNFSWPITRVIIDMSNVTMYFFIEEILGYSNSDYSIKAGSVSDISASIAGLSGLSQILVPQGFETGNFDVTYLILAIFVVFIFAVTLLAFALILLVRVVALTILLVFSPIGFVAAAFPGSFGKYASQWWDKLFAYAMKGPIMIFMLVVAIKMLEMIGVSGVGKDKALTEIFAKSNSGDDSFFSALAQNTAFFMIPIVILWTAIGAGSMGGDAVSGWATGKAKSWSKKGLKALPNFVGRSADFMANNTIGLATGGFRPYAASRGMASGIYQRGKKWAVDDPNKVYEAKKAEYEAKTKGFGAENKYLKWLPGGDAQAQTNAYNQKVGEIKADLKKNEVDINTANIRLESAINKGDKASAQALRSYISDLLKNKEGSKEEFAKAMELFNQSLEKFGGRKDGKLDPKDKGKLDLTDKESLKVQADTNRLIDSLPDSIYEEFANGSIELDKDGKKLVDSTKDQTEVKALENVMKSFSGNKKAEGTFRAKLRNAGGEKLLADYLISVGGKPDDIIKAVKDDVMKLNAEGLGKQEKLFDRIKIANDREISKRTDADKAFIELGKSIQDRFSGNASFSNEFMAKTKEKTRSNMFEAGILPAGHDLVVSEEKKIVNNPAMNNLNNVLNELATLNRKKASGGLIRIEENKAQALRNHIVNNLANNITSNVQLDQTIGELGRDNVKDIEKLISNISNPVIQQLGKSSSTSVTGTDYGDTMMNLQGYAGSEKAQVELAERMAENDKLDVVIDYAKNSGKTQKEIFDGIISKISPEYFSTKFTDKLDTFENSIYKEVGKAMKEALDKDALYRRDFLKALEKNVEKENIRKSLENGGIIARHRDGLKGGGANDLYSGMI